MIDHLCSDMLFTLLQMPTHFQMEDQREGVDSYLKTRCSAEINLVFQKIRFTNFFSSLRMAEEIEVCTVCILLFLQEARIVVDRLRK